jgi:hypothetical protein
MRILDDLTLGWGAEVHGDGKTVWFEFEAEDPTS